MGLAFYNQSVSQKEIRDAGQPVHPDLHENDINTALRKLRLDYLAWEGPRGRIGEYLAWIKANIAHGFPVLCGMKINPTQHPYWACDHFVLAVGYDESGLYINTNLKAGQLLVTYEQLQSTTFRYAFENRYHAYFGRALTGVRP